MNQGTSAWYEGWMYASPDGDKTHEVHNYFTHHLAYEQIFHSINNIPLNFIDKRKIGLVKLFLRILQI